MTALAWSIVAVLGCWCAVLSLTVLSEVRLVEELRQRVGMRPSLNPRTPHPLLGETLPLVEGRDVHGEAFATADLRGSPGLLLFVQQGCPACHRMGECRVASFRRGRRASGGQPGGNRVCRPAQDVGNGVRWSGHGA